MLIVCYRPTTCFIILIDMKQKHSMKKSEIENPIYFATNECSFGTLLVAASKKGICAIFIGDDSKTLLKELQSHFPKTHLISNDIVLKKTVAQIIQFIEKPEAELNLELDVQGTAFQQKVWQRLRKIPIGATASYSQIAQSIGRPKAVRAVANACAKNNIAVAIPCHRVVRNNGSLSGYRWGVKRKQALLKREEKSMHSVDSRFIKVKS